MTKKSNLISALHQASGKKTVEMIIVSPKEMPKIKEGHSSSRAGKKVIAGHFDPAVVRQLKILAMNQDSSIQAMLSEALNDLFEKHNMKSIA